MLKRRTFIAGVGSAVGAGAVGAAALAKETPAPSAARVDGRQALPRRTLGRTGADISIVGFPGLALQRAEQKECTEAIHKAFANGVNYFDVAPAYGKDGICEVRMGEGLVGIDRSKYFLSCKTKRRDAAGAREELERSLKRLKTDHFDLYQLHHLRFPDEVKQALGPGGAMETILKAKEEGKVKHIGFSAHTTKGAMLALQGFDFDTVMFPVNFVEWHTIGFGKPVLELAKKKGAAVISIKPVSRGLWPKDVEKTYQWWYRPTETMEEIGLSMRFALEQEGVVTGIPVSFLDIFAKCVEACGEDRPNTKEEAEKIHKLGMTCLSVFHREEKLVAMHNPGALPAYPDSPHEGCPCAMG